MANIKQTKERKQDGGETQGEVINCAATPSRWRPERWFLLPDCLLVYEESDGPFHYLRSN